MKAGDIIEIKGMVCVVSAYDGSGCGKCVFKKKEVTFCDDIECGEFTLIEIPVELIEKIEQLEKQIEDMKGCNNCKYQGNKNGKCDMCSRRCNWEPMKC